MKFAMALVEGQTEEAFIKFVLNPYLNGFNIDLTPIVFTTCATPTGPHYKGGIGSQFNPIQRVHFKFLAGGEGKRSTSPLCQNLEIHPTPSHLSTWAGLFLSAKPVNKKTKPFYA